MHSEFYDVVRKEKKSKWNHECLLVQSKGKSSAPGIVNVYEWHLGYVWQ